MHADASPPSPAGKHLDTWRCGANGGCNAMMALSWAAAAPRTTTSSGFMSNAASAALGPDSRGASSGGASLAAASLPAPVPEHGGDGARTRWQLLSGHDSGQVLVWNVGRDTLAPACKLGEGGSPVRAVVALDAWGLIATAHANGELTVFARAAQAADWGGGALSGAASHALSSASVGSAHDSGSGSGGHTTSVGVACVRPRRVVVRAHRSAITAAAGCAAGLVTASSQGTLRLWRAADLAREADKGGLQLYTGRRTTMSNASVGSMERWVPGQTGGGGGLHGTTSCLPACFGH